MNTIEKNELFDWKNEIVWKNPEDALKILSKRVESWVEITWKSIEIWEKIAQLDKENTQKFEDILKRYLEIETV